MLYFMGVYIHIDLVANLRELCLRTYEARLSQSKEISSDLCCFCGGGISHNEDALFSKVYCCLILNYPTTIEIWIWN